MTYQTIYEQAEVKIPIEKCKFIGHIKPVETEEEAQAFIASIKKKHQTATHNVPVYVIGKNLEYQRCSDDGEPSGTAGVPILDMLKKEAITNVCIVVTRYFGGIKLGTGGLVRAYTQTAKAALEEAQVVKMVKYALVRFKIPYALQGKLQYEMEHIETLKVESIAYEEEMTYQVSIEPSEISLVEKLLSEITSGSASVAFEEEIWRPVFQKNS